MHLSSSPSAEQILTDMTKQRHKWGSHKKAKGTALQICGSQMKKQLNNESWTCCRLSRGEPLSLQSTNQWKSKMQSPRKTFVAKLQSIHFLPSQQLVKQTRRALPAIIPISQEFNRLKNKSAREKALDSLRCEQEWYRKLKKKQDVRRRQVQTNDSEASNMWAPHGSCAL